MTHSKTFIKRMLGHPAVRRVRAAPDPGPPTLATLPVPRRPSGYLPPAPGAAPGALPFAVARTAVGRQLPVYRDYTNGRTRTTTVVRRVTGDAAALADEIARVTGGARVDVGHGRAVVVEGDRADQLRLWLAGLGF